MAGYIRNIMLFAPLVAVACSEQSGVTKYESTFTRTFHVNANKVNYQVPFHSSPLVPSDSIFMFKSVSTLPLDEITNSLPAGRPIWKIRVTGISMKVIKSTLKKTTVISWQFNDCDDRGCRLWSMLVIPEEDSQFGINFDYADQRHIGSILHHNQSLNMTLTLSCQGNAIPAELTLEVALNVIADIPNE